MMRNGNNGYHRPLHFWTLDKLFHQSAILRRRYYIPSIIAIAYEERYLNMLAHLPNHDAKSLIPLAGAPISHTSHTLHSLPLYSEWCFEPSNGQEALGEPL